MRIGASGRPAGRDDVLRGPSEEQAAQRGRSGCSGRGRPRSRRTRTSANPMPGWETATIDARDPHRGVQGVDQRELRVHVGRLDLGAPAHRPQPAGERVRRPPLGVGAGSPARRTSRAHRRSGSLWRSSCSTARDYRRKPGLWFHRLPEWQELVDARHSKADGPSGRVGSNPTSGIGVPIGTLGHVRPLHAHRSRSAAAAVSLRPRRRRPRSSSRRATTSRRPTPCWRSAPTRRGRGSRAACAGGSCRTTPIPTSGTGC